MEYYRGVAGVDRGVRLPWSIKLEVLPLLWTLLLLLLPKN